jgi:alpha-tubulin suppressor-like RCC1 family protein
MLPRLIDLEGMLAEGDGTVEDVACGATFTVALTSTGVPYQWGTLNGEAAYRS